MIDITILIQAGISEKAAQLYIALLSFGPSSVRRIAQNCGINRGSAYDYLKQLQEAGLVVHFHKQTKQQFVAQHPSMVRDLLLEREKNLAAAKIAFDRALPELEALHHSGGNGPVARYFEQKDIHRILEDVLTTCEIDVEPLYRVYSVEGIREYLYKKFPTFSDVRIAKGVAVRAIAIGKGGELRGLDERRLLSLLVATPTYIIIYPGKTAYISLNAKSEAVGVVIENAGVYETQKVIFDTLWETL